MLVRAADAMFFCGLATATAYSRVGDDLIHEPTFIPKGQGYSRQNNKTHTHCTAPCLMWLAAKFHTMWASWLTRMSTKIIVIIGPETADRCGDVDYCRQTIGSRMKCHWARHKSLLVKMHWMRLVVWQTVLQRDGHRSDLFIPAFVNSNNNIIISWYSFLSHKHT